MMVKKIAPELSRQYVAVAIDLACAGFVSLSDRLHAACADAGLTQTGEIRRLGANKNWVAAETPVTCPDNCIGTARRTLTTAFARTGGDIGLIPAENRRKKLLVCDMDSTIITGECIDELAALAGLGDAIAIITAQAMEGTLDFETALSARARKLAGLPLDTLRQCYEDRLSLMPGARTLIATMKAHGAPCYLVSGGFDYFAARIVAKVGFDGFQANRLIDDGKVLTGALAQPILGRAAKRDFFDKAVMEAGLGREDGLAMGDGANDLDMIRAAGLGLAVHAKPVITAAADAAIINGDLTSALYFQGYTDTEITWMD